MFFSVSVSARRETEIEKLNGTTKCDKNIEMVFLCVCDFASR